MQELLDHFFPPTSLLVQSGGEEYTDFAYWRDTPQELDDFSTTDSEDEEEAAEDEVLDDEDADDEIYDGDELSDGEGSEYLEEAPLEGTDMGASFMSQGSIPVSNPAGSIVESVEDDQDLKEELAEEAHTTTTKLSATDSGAVEPMSLPIRPKAPREVSTP